MTALQQLRAELRSTLSVLEVATDAHTRRVLEGEVSYIEDAIAFQQQIEARFGAESEASRG